MNNRLWVAFAIAVGLFGYALGVWRAASKSQVASEAKIHASAENATVTPAETARHTAQPTPPWGPPRVRESSASEVSPQTRPPESAESKASFRSEMVAKMGEERRRDYAPFLSGLGLDAEHVEKILARLDRVHSKAIGAGDAMLELLGEKQAHDKSMRELLTPEAYASYKAFEQAKPYRREASMFKEFASGHGVQLSADDVARVSQVFQDLIYFTGVSWDGPYDERPTPLLGSDIMPLQQQFLNSAQRALAELTQGGHAGISDSVQNAMAGYLATRVSEIQSAIADLDLSDEERMARIRAFVDQVRARARENR